MKKFLYAFVAAVPFTVSAMEESDELNAGSNELKIMNDTLRITGEVLHEFRQCVIENPKVKGIKRKTMHDFDIDNSSNKANRTLEEEQK